MALPATIKSAEISDESLTRMEVLAEDLSHTQIGPFVGEVAQMLRNGQDVTLIEA